jgi:adenine-specific DNA methylase
MSKKQVSEIKEEAKNKTISEPFYTDILEEYFVGDDGIEYKKRTFMNKEEFVKEEIVNS